MHQLRCEIFLRAPGVADKSARAACARASELAPGDPAPHLAVAEALVKIADLAGARAELSQAEGKIANLAAGADDAWRRVIGIYQGMGALTWTEEAIAKAKLTGDPVAQQIAQTRARYGVPKGARVPPEQEAALVAAVRGALDLVYASKFGEAEKTLAAAERRWPNAAGLLGARCDLAFRMAQTEAARAACARAIALDADASWALYLSGVIALRDTSPGGTRAGIEKLKRAIAVDPELGQAWRTLAKAYGRAKDKAALEQLARDYAARFGQPLPP
jgi:tetratricopeptide (TPR) repeat protein